MTSNEMILLYGRAMDREIRILEDDPELALAHHAFCIATQGEEIKTFHMFIVRDEKLLEKWSAAAEGFKEG